MTMIWGKPWSKRIMCVELRQWSHLRHTLKPAQRKFGGKRRKFADMLYCRLHKIVVWLRETRVQEFHGYKRIRVRNYGTGNLPSSAKLIVSIKSLHN